MRYGLGWSVVPINIFWLIGVEDGIESQVDLVINPFEEVLSRGLGNQSIYIAKRVFLITDAVVRRDDDI